LAKAFPPRRIVQVAKGFGANGFIQSICQDDFSGPIDVLVQTIAKQLGAACLPRPIARNADGLIDCDIVWELSPQPTGDALASCSERPFLSDTGRVGNTGGRVCRVAQLPAGDDHELVDDGWFYDDFSALTQQACLGGTKQRISFTSGAEPPAGTVTKLNCFETEYFAGDIDELDDLDDGDNDPAPFPLDCEEDADCPSQWSCEEGMCSPGDICSAGPSSAHPEKVGDPCFSLIVPEGGFDDSQAYVEGNSPYCNDGACLVFHLAGDPRADCSLRGSIGGEGTSCANPQEVESRVYCSCRCDSPEDFAECQCPDGYSCVDVLDNGPPEIAGGYCVRDGTVFQ
ncbi:MAG TPA: hypothetical protein VFG30_23550, partial [Polyangiales bacterium]|nr:hypothetical protein [Polyangiales bacterium]